MSAAVKRACDACHRRKVKCDGINPCRNCATAQLSCTYNAIPQKKGPKGSRAKVISELRETQRQTSLAARVQNRVAGLTAGPSQNPTTAGPSPGMVTGELVKECFEFFFSHMYSSMPFLVRQKIEQQAMFMEQNRDSYCLVTALCAFVMLQPGMTMPSSDPYNLDMMPGSNLIASTLLLEEAMRVRNGYEYLDTPTLNSIATSYFFFACNYGVESHSKAWYYLREASTMMHMLDMHKEETYLQWDPVEASRRRRLYWLIFSTERAYALQRQRPVTLQASINLPTMADDPTDPLASELAPFIALVNSFRLFDDSLLSTWNKTAANFTSAYTANLQKQLNDIMPSYVCQDSQFNDMSTSQQWLKTTHWQLSSQGEDNGMGFQFPAEVAREMVVSWASQFPGQGVQLIGSGFIEKLFEIANDATTALSHKPLSRDRFTVGPRERLSQILNIVAVLKNGDQRFIPLLFNKLTEALPRLVTPMLQNAPECVSANLANIDIFDGFGNAGMAQAPPGQMHLGLDTEDLDKFGVPDYDRKFSLASMNNSSPDSSMGNNGSATMSMPPGTSPDMAPSFATSPPIMSPGIDFSQNMNDFSFPDMMMQRMGGQNSQPQMNQQHSGMPMLQSQNFNPQQMHGQMGQQSPQSMGVLNSQTPSQMGNPQQSMMNQKQNIQGQMPMMHAVSPQGANMVSPGMGIEQQRGKSFTLASHPAHQAPGIPRTVGDFHALQRSFP
ncbi:hypothetical protein jhhlp_002874 [Lomentospora prolificans]|uniref:Zn(2)-C6 fungal-type domain-containing protein n=1 Tax=Lomentospora prolificans TaxID=41688 RepID=A0A2N3NFA2_9PEZI|nr:hypothetical protein jhhlp_002874 [Lomentospora prolificans]